MYTVIKRMEISSSHQLHLDYISKCSNVHGHNWLVTVYLRSKNLDRNGMVCDFTHIKEAIVKKMDHQHLNNVLQQPTAENIAKYICDLLGEKCFKVEVQESSGNMVIYER